MEHVIKAENLAVGYDKDELVITNANITVDPHDFTFITGKSGSGKSTILKTFYRELIPKNGNLSVCGVDVKNISQKKLNLLRRYIGIVFQDYKLINEWSVERNVMLPLLISGFGKDVCVKQAHKLLKHVKLLHKADKYPFELSGGEQQRIAMARALAHNPVMILADEPTGNLDNYSSEVIWDLLKKAQEHLGTTIVVVTHHIPSTLGIHYRNYFIDEGNIYEVT